MFRNEGEEFTSRLSLELEDNREWQFFWQKMILPERIQIAIPIPRKKIIILSGPTGVGKTELSLMLAQAIGGEIISADSMQVYRGMDIGTAKASLQEREAIPHHLIDIRDLEESFNVVDFCQEATKAIDDICARGHVPIVVGGTGFYINALLYGPPSGPPSSATIRANWEREMEEKGSLILFEKVRELDPEYASTITHNDKHKIIRALEIITLTKKRVSDFVRQKDVQKYDARCWFLHMSKELLYRRIDLRCDEMVKKGFLDEVKLLDTCGLRENSSASQAIGYRQCLDFLDSPQRPEDWAAFMVSFKQASRRYAKRQFTWFRKEPLFRWLSREDVSFDRAAEIILQDFELSF
jgi:tRNA dimethylallyltransferase